MEIFLNLIPALFLIFITIFARIQQKNWLAPGSFFLLVTAIYVIAPLLFAPSNLVWHGSLWWIVLCVVTLYFGTIIGMCIRSKKKTQELSLNFVNLNPFKGLKKWTILFSAIGFVGLLYFINSIGFTLQVFENLNLLGNVSSSISNSRYTGGYSQPALYNVALTFNYLAGFLGGMLWTFQKSKIAFLPFIPIILTTALTTTKSVIIFVTLFWIGGFLASKVLTKQYKVFTPKLVLGGLLAWFILNTLFVLYSMLRYNMMDIKYLGSMYGRLAHYYFGYLAAFSEWFRNFGYGWNELLWSKMTLAGIWDVLGVKRAQGMYDKFIIINPKTGSTTNIYSIYRFLIDDFGLIGSIIVFLLIGIIVGYAFKQVSNGRLIFMPILMLFYAQVLFSNTTSILSYNTLLAAWLGVSVYLICISIPELNQFAVFKINKKIRRIR